MKNLIVRNLLTTYAKAKAKIYIGQMLRLTDGSDAGLTKFKNFELKKWTKYERYAPFLGRPPLHDATSNRKRVYVTYPFERLWVFTTSSKYRGQPCHCPCGVVHFRHRVS